MEAGTIRVLIADDHGVVRAGLRLLLDAEPGVEVVGEAATLEELERRLPGLAPDVLLLDLHYGGTTAMEAIPRLRELAPGTGILVLTMQSNPSFARAALQAGALGYVVKEAADRDLVRAIRSVAEGTTYLDPGLGARLVAGDERERSPHADLTERERDVLQLLALGHTNPEIAQELYLSVRTVESHRGNLQRKLGLSTRAELVRYAIERGILTR